VKEKKCKQGGIFYIASALALAVFFSACDTPPGGFWEYGFVNNTPYSITVYLDEEFYNTQEEEVTYTQFSLSSNNSKIVYVKSGSVGFEWSAGSAANNHAVAPETKGSKVTFKARTQ
jgi:hypothetical protein